MAPTLEEFVAARGEALMRFALMLCGDRHSAEDLTQSVLAKAYPRWLRISNLEQPDAYLKRMIVNEHLRWRRRLWRGEIPVATPGEARLGSRACDVVASSEDSYANREAAWELLGRLPRKQRAVLVLRYYEDLADAEIAAILGCRTGTVRSQATRALASLRSVLPTMRKETLP